MNWYYPNHIYKRAVLLLFMTLCHDCQLPKQLYMGQITEDRKNMAKGNKGSQTSQDKSIKKYGEGEEKMSKK